MRDTSANRKAGEVLTPQPISASGAALRSLSSVALSPAGSVVVYLNSSTAAPAGAAQGNKTAVDTRGRSHRWLRTPFPSPLEFKADVAELETFLRELEARQTEAEKARKILQKPPGVLVGA